MLLTTFVSSPLTWAMLLACRRFFHCRTRFSVPALLHWKDLRSGVIFFFPLCFSAGGDSLSELKGILYFRPLLSGWLCWYDAWWNMPVYWVKQVTFRAKRPVEWMTFLSWGFTLHYQRTPKRAGLGGYYRSGLASDQSKKDKSLPQGSHCRIFKFNIKMKLNHFVLFIFPLQSFFPLYCLQ